MSDDYISREAAIRALEFRCKILTARGGKTAADILTRYGIKTIRNHDGLPAADVRPVVFCKDCRHRDPEDHKCDSGETERQGCPFPVHDDYFCAYGER